MSVNDPKRHSEHPNPRDADARVPKNMLQRLWKIIETNQVIAFAGVAALLVALFGIQVARNTEATKSRATLTITEMKIQCEIAFCRDDHRFGAQFQADHVEIGVLNGGETIATNVRAFFVWYARPFGKPIADDFIYDDNGRQIRPNVPGGITTPTTIAKGETKHLGGLIYPDISSLDRRDPGIWRIVNEIADARAKRSSLYIYGDITYSDAFGEDWVRHFCYVFVVDLFGEHAEPWGPHNYEDRG